MSFLKKPFLVGEKFGLCAPLAAKEFEHWLAACMYRPIVAPIYDHWALPGAWCL